MYALFAILLLSCSITHAEAADQNETPGHLNAGAMSNQLLEQEAPLSNDDPESSWLNFGGSLGFGASYVALGTKFHIGTPYVRLLGVIGLGVGAGVDVKLNSKMEAGFTRVFSLGGAGWDAVALRYHHKGAFERGWFLGIEHIGNRVYRLDDVPETEGRTWLVTFGYEFW